MKIFLVPRFSKQSIAQTNRYWMQIFKKVNSWFLKGFVEATNFINEKVEVDSREW